MKNILSTLNQNDINAYISLSALSNENVTNGTYTLTTPYCTQYNGTVPSPGAIQYLLTNCTTI